jgi:hypothetical protein
MHVHRRKSAVFYAALMKQTGSILLDVSLEGRLIVSMQSYILKHAIRSIEYTLLKRSMQLSSSGSMVRTLVARVESLLALLALVGER